MSGGKRKREQRDDRPDRRHDELEQRVDAAERTTAPALIARWRAPPRRDRRRSACLRAGRPRLRVASPLPVSTSIGAAPTAAAACRSRSESPTLGTPFRSTLKRRAISSSSPGLGLAAVAVRVLRRAGRRRSRRCARRSARARGACVSWIAFSVDTSKSPRPTPDWFVASTTWKPAWFSRAIASRLPGIGRHSSGALDEGCRCPR